MRQALFHCHSGESGVLFSIMKLWAAFLGAALLLTSLSSLRADTSPFDRVHRSYELEGFHLGASALYITGSDWDDGFGGALEAGYRFSPGRTPTLRHGPSLETGYYSLKSKRSGARADFDVIPLIANYLLAAEIVDHIWVYGGGGGGLAFVDIDPDNGAGGSDQTTLWQAFIGMEGAVTEWASLRGGYRHQWLGSSSSGDARIHSTSASVFELGVNFWY